MKTNSELIGYFNDLSASYVTNEYASFYITNYMRRKLIKRVKNFENKCVLDIMSGKGENLTYISKHKSTKITTIDFSSKMNEAARLNLKEKTIHQIESDFFKINNKPNYYNIILCSFGIKTIEKHKLNLFTEKINDLLKYKGEILLLELVKPKLQLNFKILKFYLKVFIPTCFGSKFKALFPYVNNHKNMDSLKQNLINKGLKIIEHKRFFDLFEIIHAKKV